MTDYSLPVNGQDIKKAKTFYLDFPITLHSSLRICIYFLNFFKNLLHFRGFLFIIECNGCTR